MRLAGAIICPALPAHLETLLQILSWARTPGLLIDYLEH